MPKIFRVDDIYSSQIEEDLRHQLALSVARHYRHVDVKYVEACFERYPRVVISYFRGECSGLFFYTFYCEHDEGYLYIGPLFFFSRPAFALATLKILRAYARCCTAVFVLAEVQNPELIIHLHSVFGRFIHPKPFSFSITDDAIGRVKTFQRHTPQLDAICLKTFCSQGKSSLFYRNKKGSVMNRWLLKNGIDFSNNQALVMLIELNRARLLFAQALITLRILTYPHHKRAYYKKLQELLGESSCHQ